MYFKQTFFLSCLTVSFASQSSNSMTGQSYRKINFPLQVWNLVSSSKTEEVSIAPNSLKEGIMECGVACNIKSDCGGFLYDKTSGGCTMKSVKNICISIELFWFVLSNVFLQQFLCLLKLTTPSDVQSSVGVYVKTERFAPCLGLGKLDCKEVDKKIFDRFFSLLLWRHVWFHRLLRKLLQHLFKRIKQKDPT